MNPNDVQFTKRMTDLYLRLKGKPRTKEGELWDDESIEKEIEKKKTGYLESFEQSMATAIDYSHPELGFEYRRKGMVHIKKLIIDTFHEHPTDEYSARYSLFLGLGVVPKNVDLIEDLYFIGFRVGLVIRTFQIKSKSFDFNDLSINHIHDMIQSDVFAILNSSIDDSAPVKYIEKTIKPNPIMDKLDKEERDIFKGVF